MSPVDLPGRAAEALAVRQEVARHVLWHNGDPRGQEPGSFTAKLLEAWARADQDNSARLRAVFPTLGAAVHISQSEGSEALARWAELTAEVNDPRPLSFVAGDVVVSHFDDEAGAWTHLELTEEVEGSDEWRTVASLLLSDVEADAVAKRLTDRTAT